MPRQHTRSAPRRRHKAKTPLRAPRFPATPTPKPLPLLLKEEKAGGGRETASMESESTGCEATSARFVLAMSWMMRRRESSSRLLALPTMMSAFATSL
eukprot:3937826-Rhodomonas_salina.2